LPTNSYRLEAIADPDPTVDSQVGAGADDGQRFTGSGGFNAGVTKHYLGYINAGTHYHMHGFARWTGITIEGTIDVSYMEYWAAAGQSGTPQLKVYGVDEDNPAAPTSAAEFDADALTTASVDWDGAFTDATWEQSPSLNTIFQELVDTYTISGDAVMLQIKNDGGTTTRYNEVYQYDSAAAEAPKLHIEYTAAGITLTPSAVTAPAAVPAHTIISGALIEPSPVTIPGAVPTAAVAAAAPADTPAPIRASRVTAPPSLEVWLATAEGTKIALLDQYVQATYAKATNSVGGYSIMLPNPFDSSLLAIDQRVQFWRKPTSGAAYIDFQGFVRKFVRKTDARMVSTIIVSGPDMNDLLRRRIVAYYAGSAQSSMTDQADDMMKEIVRDNLAGDAVAARDITSYGFSVQANLTAAPSITKAFSWHNVLAVLQDIAKASVTAGTYLYFDIVPTTDTAFEFRTYIDQRGADRTYPDGASPVIIGQQWQNLRVPTLTHNWLEERNYIYGGGQGEKSNRNIQEVSDATRIGVSVYGRREGFREATDRETDAGVEAAAQAELQLRAPTIGFTGQILDTGATRYGLDWGFGDKVTVQHRGFSFDAWVNAVKVSVQSSGKETVVGKLVNYG
jgi:hypothetical protein